jgi:large subunit ribosomal protein L9
MKVILNQDLASLGEEGDVKDVARGYARNYLFPRSIALPYTEQTIKLFEGRKEEIEGRKEQKRKDALGLKEKIETLSITIIMPAGTNGKLYGAVTNHTVAEELAKQGLEIERKRIEVPGNGIKTVGKYKSVVKLYGSASAELNVSVEAAEIKAEVKATHAQERHRKHSEPAKEGVATEDIAVKEKEAAESVAQ